MKATDLSVEVKQRIIQAIKKDRENYPSNKKHSIALGIDSSIYSRITEKGETEKVLSPETWICLSYRLGVILHQNEEWKTAETPVFTYITTQLAACQEESISKLLCDIPNIGKTHTAKVYCKKHENAVYVDCSQVKSKQKLIRHIARELGLSATARYNVVYEDLCNYILSIDKPLIILDEAGDLEYPAFLELKGIWNATENSCGWYMMGADGLRAKIESLMKINKVGYAEIFSRFGNQFDRITGNEESKRNKFIRHNIAMVVKLNAPEDADIMTLILHSNGSLRRARTEIKKLRLKG